MKNTLSPIFISFCISPPQLKKLHGDTLSPDPYIVLHFTPWTKKVAWWYPNSIKVSTLPAFRPFVSEVYACHSPEYQWKWPEKRQNADFYWVQVSPFNFFRFKVQNDIKARGKVFLTLKKREIEIKFKSNTRQSSKIAPKDAWEGGRSVNNHFQALLLEKPRGR